jgi:short-subunit dehydrogenase
MKVTLITGASGGIGEAFAKRLASEKHNLLLVARNEARLQNLCSELNTKYQITAQYIAIDLSKPDADKTIFEETQNRNLQVDWLINNAGIGSGGEFLEYTLPEYLTMMHLNMDAMVALCYRYLPPMRSRKSGIVINVGSMAGFTPIPYMNVYAATKNFVRAFTQALAEENRLYDIQIMLLCPGATETGFFDAAKIDADRKSSFSTKKLETPEQVVESAMKGLKNKKVTTISGFQNKVGKSILAFIPTSWGLKMYGNSMRKNLKIEIK